MGGNNILEVLKSKDNYLITSHVNPEGDSIGSQIAMFYILQKLGKQAVMVNHDDVPDNLTFLPQSNLITTRLPDDFEVDACIILDCPVKERIGDVCREVKKEHFIINIDHHISNEYFGDINWVQPEASSVGEMIFSLVKGSGIEITKDLAMAIYTAILTDTGMFNYDNTSRRTHEVAGELIAYGVKPKEMNRQIFEKKSLAEVRLLGKALTTLQLEADGRLAHMCLTRKMYQEENVEHISTDEFINFPRSIKGVEIAIFFKEKTGGHKGVNISFRSSGKFDVNAIAALFGGGGHAQASGCVLEEPLGEAQKRVLDETRKILKEDQ